MDAALGHLDQAWLQPTALWVESWRFAMRDPELRLDVMADYSGWRELIAAAVAEGVESGQFGAALDPSRAAIQIVALLDGIVIPWFSATRPFHPMEPGR